MTTTTNPTPTQPAAAATRFENGLHREVGGLHMLRLKGTHYEMGRQHGALLGEQVEAGPIPYYRTYVQRIFKNAGLGPFSPVAWSLLRSTVGRSVKRNLPDFADQAIRGLSAGSGIPRQKLLDGYTMPDSLMWVAARLMQLKRRGPALHHRLALGLGCTSAIAWGDATPDGKLLHARNFDYHGVDCWPKSAAVIFHDPDEGQRYVSVGAAGVLLGGVTAMNEAGLSLTVHQHMFTDATRLGGMPIGVLGDRVMRDAENLDDAEAILREHTPIGCWTYLITDGKAGEVMCYEEDPTHKATRRYGREAGTLGYSNIYLDEGLGATEQNLYPSYWRANQGRYERANELLEAGRGELDAGAMAEILGDIGTTECRVRDSIAMLMTVGSVVFKPEDGVVWVAGGEAPVSHNGFQPFSLATMDHAPEWGVISGAGAVDVDSREAFEAYRQAYVAYFDDDDVGGARVLAEVASKRQPGQSLYHFLAGLLAMKRADGARAARCFDAALDAGHPDPERVGSFNLWRGRAADLEGQRDDALAYYRAVLGGVADPMVAKAARRGVKRAYGAKQAERIGIEFSFIDVIDP